LPFSLRWTWRRTGGLGAPSSPVETEEDAPLPPTGFGPCEGRGTARRSPCRSRGHRGRHDPGWRLDVPARPATWSGRPSEVRVGGRLPGESAARRTAASRPTSGRRPRPHGSTPGRPLDRDESGGATDRRGATPKATGRGKARAHPIRVGRSARSDKGPVACAIPCEPGRQKVRKRIRRRGRNGRDAAPGRAHRIAGSAD
jgi:hypothetical protein